MGVCGSKDDKDQEGKNKEIEKQMMADHMAESKIIKLLLLGKCLPFFLSRISLFHANISGAGECGKSTILKQMKFVSFITNYVYNL